MVSEAGMRRVLARRNLLPRADVIAVFIKLRWAIASVQHRNFSFTFPGMSGVIRRVRDTLIGVLGTILSESLCWFRTPTKTHATAATRANLASVYLAILAPPSNTCALFWRAAPWIPDAI